jgi:hypothetical protein
MTHERRSVRLPPYDNHEPHASLALALLARTRRCSRLDDVVGRRGLQLQLEHRRRRNGPGRQFAQRQQLVGECERELEQRQWEHLERRRIILIGKRVVFYVRRWLGELIVRRRLLLRKRLRRFFVRRRPRRIWVRRWLRQRLILDLGKLVVVQQLLWQRIFLRLLR